MKVNKTAIVARSIKQADKEQDEINLIQYKLESKLLTQLGRKLIEESDYLYGRVTDASRILELGELTQAYIKALHSRMEIVPELAKVEHQYTRLSKMVFQRVDHEI